MPNADTPKLRQDAKALGVKDLDKFRTLVVERYGRWRAAKSTWANDAVENTAFFLGEQWGEPRQGQYVQQHVESWRTQHVENYISMIIEARVGQILSADPVFEAQSKRPGAQHQAEAQAATAILNGQLEEIRFSDVFHLAIKNALIKGTGFIWVGSDPQLGPRDEAGVPQGAVTAKSIPPEDVFVDPTMEDDTKIAELVHRQRYTPEAARELWPDAAEIWPEDADDLGADSDDDERQDGKYRGSDIETALSGRRQTAKILVYYRLPSQAYPSGLLVNIEEETGKVIGIGPYPYKHGRLCVHTLRDLVVPSRFWGVAAIRDSVKLQKQLNHLVSKVFNHLELSAYGITYVPRGAQLSKKPTSQPGQIIEYDPPFRPTVERPQPIAGEVFRQISDIRQALETISGYNRIQQGRSDGPVRTTGGVVELGRRSDQRWIHILQSFERVLARVATDVLDVIRETYEDGRVLRMIGPRHAEGYELFSKQVLPEETSIEFRVARGSLSSTTPEAQRQTLADLLQNPQLFSDIPGPQLRKMLGAPNIEDDFDPDAAQEQLGRRYVARILAGELPDAPDAHELHEVVWSAAQRYLQSAEGIHALDTAAQQLEVSGRIQPETAVDEVGAPVLDAAGQPILLPARKVLAQRLAVQLDMILQYGAMQRAREQQLSQPGPGGPGMGGGAGPGPAEQDGQMAPGGNAGGLRVAA